MVANPNPARITNAMWWLWEQLQALEPVDGALGGIYANKSGYHNTRAANDANWPGNYSVVDAVDRRGPSDKAAALDWTFRSAQRGDYSNISKYCKRLMASSLDMDDERLNGWREWYGQTDFDGEVEGWDSRYLRRVTSDSSHLWHIHFSESREHAESYDNKKALLSVLKAEPVAQWRQSKTAVPTIQEATLFAKYGDRSGQVWVLQSDLNNAGFGPVALDWIYGDQTAAALVKAGVTGGDKTGRTYGPGEYAGLQRILRHKDAREIAAAAIANIPAGPPGEKGEPGPAGPVVGSQLVVRVEEVR